MLYERPNRFRLGRFFVTVVVFVVVVDGFRFFAEANRAVSPLARPHNGTV
jgi:hypothetical protein